MDHIISEDRGKTWQEPTICFMDKTVRNPQVNQLDGIYLLHARAINHSGLVLYSSEDGQNWEEGIYIQEQPGSGYYSNNVILKDPEGNNRMLVQYSSPYRGSCVNVCHCWVRILR